MPSTRPTCLLLVDDDDLVRQTLSMMLEDEGFQVHSLPSAEAALDALRGGLEVSAAITDVDLGPGPSGIELADWLRAMRPELPVVLITGRSSALVNRAPQPGEAVLIKPFESAELKRAITHVAR